MATKISIENVSSIQRKVWVSIPASIVAAKVEKKFSEAQKVANLKGFRPGKAPMTLIKQYYADDVKNRALNALIDETYRQALIENDLRVVGEPKIEGKEDPSHLHIHDNEDLEYVATVEVIPEVELKAYKGLKVTRPSEEVTTIDVEQTKKTMLDRRATFEPVDRPARSGDEVSFRSEGALKKDGAFESSTALSGNRYGELGANRFIPEFETALIGMKPGESKKFTMTYAADFQDEALRGKEAEFELHLQEVKEKKLPDWDEELAKSMGFESVGAVDENVKKDLVSRKKKEADDAERESLIDALIEKNAIEVPQALVNNQLRANIDDYAQELKRYGFNEQMIQRAVLNQFEQFQTKATRQVKAGLLLDAVAKKEKIESNPEAVEQEIARTAAMYGVSGEDFRKQVLADDRNRRNFEFRVREELTIKFLMENAKR